MAKIPKMSPAVVRQTLDPVTIRWVLQQMRGDAKECRKMARQALRQKRHLGSYAEAFEMEASADALEAHADWLETIFQNQQR